jgi:hypothetical protein
MRGLQSSSYTGAGIPSGVHDVFTIMMLCLVEKGLNTRLCERPCAGIKRFFLAPHDGLGIGVHVKILLKLLPREWIELLNPSDGDVFDIVVGTVFVEGDINLAGTEDYAVNLLRLFDGVAMLWVRDGPSEMGIASELLNRRAAKRMPEKRLREEEDQG